MPRNNKFLWPFAKDLEARLNELYRLIKEINETIDSEQWLSMILDKIEALILTDKEFLQQISDIIIAEGTIIDAILKDKNFEAQVHQWVNDFISTPEFLELIEPKITGDPNFIKAVEDLIKQDTQFLIELANTLLQNADFVKTIQEAVSNNLITNADFLAKLTLSIIEDENFLTNVANHLQQNQTFINSLKDTISKDTDFIKTMNDTLIISLLADTNFISKVSELIAKDTDFINKIIAELKTNEELINSLKDILSKDETFLNIITNATATSLINNDEFITNVAEKLASEGQVTKDYVDTQDAKTLTDAKKYVDDLKNTDITPYQAFKLNQDGRFQFTQTDFISMNGQQISTVKDPTSDQDVATKKYIDDKIAQIPQPDLHKLITPVDIVSDIDNTKIKVHTDYNTVQLYDANDKSIVFIRDDLRLTDSNDAVRFIFNPTDGKITYENNGMDEISTKKDVNDLKTNEVVPYQAFKLTAGTNRYEYIGGGYLDLKNYQISNVKDPISNQDVATRNYVDTNLAKKQDTLTVDMLFDFFEAGDGITITKSATKIKIGAK